MVMPPYSLMAFSPKVPSESLPDKTMPTARWPWSLASEVKNRSIGRRPLRWPEVEVMLSRPSLIETSASSPST
ncbi:hypothetical protein D3C71_2066430 [compost metagenome]